MRFFIKISQSRMVEWHLTKEGINARRQVLVTLEKLCWSRKIAGSNGFIDVQHNGVAVTHHIINFAVVNLMVSTILNDFRSWFIDFKSLTGAYIHNWLFPRQKRAIPVFSKHHVILDAIQPVFHLRKKFFDHDL